MRDAEIIHKVVGEGRMPEVPEYNPDSLPEFAELKVILGRCWQSDPVQRPSAMHINRALEAIAQWFPRR
jgi:hypothetical protein